MDQISNKVKLVSQDNVVIEVDEEVAKKSQVIKHMIEDTGTEEAIPIPNVKESILRKILEYCDKHRNDNPPEIEKPLTTNNLSEVVDPYDAKFIDMENLEQLFEIILAANYLDIKSLLDLACAKVATLIKNKTPEEIRKTFNIPNDFTPEEEAQIREENKWAEEATS
ncbi:hypothetical protein IMG5_081380 [Ichthyophthirius multifiliis]|uniref:Uncharacterized protein n=1 Tax=Ichthyophthirius multifiliis TaxID=5932 RepID=G0QQM8_ICHMU|nr:hypothetical protein IMG5_081380 [Ichthyophthirius multifiliis]EGR32480.1 hypothetical protein IMG5_081380 [Ichthyophthirius multifiliis]|eukprot:XP_004036466.1 hypothetical protein IMG5_081380 [Ichthyophthirius multifiliis]